jgi:hypothetical protein
VAWDVLSCRSPHGLYFAGCCFFTGRQSLGEHGIELIKLNGRLTKPVQRIQLASDPLGPPFASEQVQRNPNRQRVVVQNRVQLAAQLVIRWVITRLRQQIAETKETTYKGTTARRKEAETLPRPGPTDDLCGFILQNDRLRRDAAHGRSGITRWVDVPCPGLPRPAKLLDCPRRRGNCLRRPAASKAAHVPTLFLQING